jgi:hypothetical protein
MEAVDTAMGDVGEADKVDLAAALTEAYPKRRLTKWRLLRLDIIC